MAHLLASSGKLRSLDALLHRLAQEARPATQRRRSDPPSTVLLIPPAPAMPSIQRLLAFRRLPLLQQPSLGRTARPVAAGAAPLAIALMPVGGPPPSPPLLAPAAVVFYDGLDSPLRQLARLGPLAREPRVFYLVHGPPSPAGTPGLEETVLRMHLRAAERAHTADAFVQEELPLPAQLIRALAA
jgi:hypothetical protein